MRLKRIKAVRDNSFFMPLTQELISDALGMSPVHVSRTFSMLRDEGLVIRNRQHVKLPDPEALSRLVEFNDSYIDEFLSPSFSELLKASP
nr:helix-turn-helix domain-containing protein [Halomonas titanicae]